MKELRIQLMLLLWCNISIIINQKLLQNALRHLLKDNKFMIHILQARHTQNVKDHHYILLMNMLQRIFIRMLCTFADMYWQWHTLLNVKNCFDITDSRSATLKFKHLRALLNIVILTAVTVIQCILSFVALLINIKVTESFLLTMIINLSESLSELHVTFSITVKSQPHSVSSKVNISVKIITKMMSSAKTELLTAV